MEVPFPRVRSLLLHRFSPRTLGVTAFFVCAFVVGLAAYRTVGLSADEPASYTAGVQLYAYLFMGGPAPLGYDWTFYNPIFHVLLFGVQRWTGIEAAQSIWLLRHLLTYCFFLTGVYAFLRIAEELLGDWRWALLGCAFFLLSPRIFAHAFYNPKDIPALVLFTIAMATLWRCRRKRYAWSALFVHASACGLAIGVRSFSLLIPVLTLLALWIDAFDGERGITKTVAAVRSALFVVGTAAILIATWPFLWSDPLGHFVSAFFNNAGRSAGGFYFGQMIQSLPWHYVPVWIAITTPPLYTILFLVGCGLLLAGALRSPIAFVRHESSWLLILLWFFAPIAALILLHIGIFDEWRHVLFLYPAFLLIGLLGAQWIFSSLRGNLRRAAVAVVCLSLGWTAVWMVRWHPLEFAYYSIPNRWVDGNFELDYWGLSYREGLAWILQHDARSAIPVYTTARVGYVSADLFPRSEWERFRFVNADAADYIVDTFDRGKGYVRVVPEDQALHLVQVDGLTLLAVYKGPDTQGLFGAHTGAGLN